jgi:hypothetical protein
MNAVNINAFKYIKAGFAAQKRLEEINIEV